MSDQPAIGDDEIVIRHIPAGTTWQAPGPPPRLTSANFRIRANKGETYLSVSRTALTTPDQLLKRVGGDVAAGSRVGWATVGAIRKLGFEVLPEPIIPDDPGHAGIHPTAHASFDDKEKVKQLAALFQYQDHSGSTTI